MDGAFVPEIAGGRTRGGQGGGGKKRTLLLSVLLRRRSSVATLLGRVVSTLLRGCSIASLLVASLLRLEEQMRREEGRVGDSERKGKRRGIQRQ